MTEAIVNYLNLKLETVGRLGVINCLAELRSDGTTTVPYVYSGTGQVVPINIDGSNLSYWRMDNPISFEPIVGKYGVNQMSGTYDLRLVVVARRKDSTVDDAFMPTRLAEDIANQITGSFPDLKLLLKAQSVSIRVNSIDTNIPKIWGEEFTGTQVNDLNYTRAIMALSVSVTVIGSRDCWQNECDIDPNILHLFNFCDPNVVDQLTATQVACLENALCEPCADATIDINGFQVANVASGGTEDIDVLSEGSNPVGSLVGSDWVIENNATTINGVQVTDQEAEQDAAIFVTRDGVQNGTWNAGIQTWEVTSAACSPVTFQINAVNKESLSSGTTFNLITKLDGAVNSGSYDAPTDTLSFTSTGGWVRPSFWPTLPTITAANQAGYILLQVYQNRLNRFTCQIYNNAAIDWGDGTTSAPTTAVRTKTYTYSTLSGTVYVDALTSENYKFVTIAITASGGNIAYVDFAVSSATSPLNSPSYAIDWNLSFPSATQIHFGGVFTRDTSLMQQLRLWAVGSGCYLRFQKSYNLQSLQLPVSMVLSQPSIATNIGPCRVGNLDYSTTTNISNNFSTTRILSHGNLIANSATNIGVYLADATACESVGTVTCNAVVGGATSTFSGMFALRSIGLLTMPLATDYSSMFANDYVLNAIRFANSAACTTTTSMISNCLSLQVLHLPNLTRGVNFTNTSIGNYGMNIFASGDGILNGIGTASGAQTITITGTPFGVLVTAADATALAIRLVMTGKGYTIAN